MIIPVITQAAIYTEDQDDLFFPGFSDTDFSKPYGDSSLKFETETYGDQFINALLAFKENRVEEALTIAISLHENYPKKVDPIKLMAASYMRLAQWDKAKIELEKALKLDPKDPSSTRNLAIIEMQTGSTQRSRELLQSMLKETPDDKELVQLLKEVEKYEKKRSAKGGSLGKVVSSNPQDLDARVQLAAQLLKAGNYTKVLEVTDDLQNDQYKKQPVLLELRGKAQVLQGEYDAAQTTFKQWTKNSPQSADAYFYYGDSLLRNGDMAAAQQTMERAIKIDPKHLLARIAEVKLLWLINKSDDAQQALAQLKKDFANRVEVQSIAGWLALNTGDFSTAEKEFSKVFRKQPSSKIVVQLVRAKWGQKKHEESIALMQNWLNDHPQDQAVLLYLAGSYLALKHNNEAIGAYEKVAALNPDYVPVLNNLAWLNRDKDLTKAMQYIKKARKLAPEDAYVLDTFGMLTLKNGDLERAYDFVKKAAERLPNEAQIHLHLSQILIQKKNYSEAEKILNALISQLPNSEIGDEASKLLNQIPKNTH